MRCFRHGAAPGRRPAGAGRIAAACGLISAAGLLAGCSQAAGAGHGQRAAAASPAATRSPAAGAPAAGALPAGATPAVSPTPAAWPLVVAVPPARAGQHQTTQRPTARNPLFQDEITDLWAGIASGRPQLAMAAFFPVMAYEQVKAIPDPAADWRNRLVAEYREDIMAAHALLRGGGRQARLVRVVVPESEAGWISPGVCDNAVGYWHVAGARVVYRVRGRTRSFGIAALIGWRGRWYVVHLGGELRTGPGGVVDEPADGPGVPGPPGGC